jgi:hypothetical protein
MVEKHKTEWRVMVGRATGILVLLGGILLVAGLCDATAPPDNSVPSICYLSPVIADGRVVGIGARGAFGKGMDAPVITSESHLVVDAIHSVLSTSTKSPVLGCSSRNCQQ